MERLTCGQDDVGQYDIEQGKLFWKSKNYEEYAMMCDLEGISPAFTEQQFYAMKI